MRVRVPPPAPLCRAGALDAIQLFSTFLKSLLIPLVRGRGASSGSTSFRSATSFPACLVPIAGAELVSSAFLRLSGKRMATVQPTDPQASRGARDSSQSRVTVAPPTIIALDTSPVLALRRQATDEPAGAFGGVGMAARLDLQKRPNPVPISTERKILFRRLHGLARQAGGHGSSSHLTISAVICWPPNNLPP